ncbi:MAG: tRNA (N6-isopentenyl adenosine(37)-C2)-methylthiotransferase MiaB [Dehalococcoidia bacterium]|nr:tRNA (N6-isopentenyl adenosine(37)-C2)-methylthiotransferase MiaB [Dehalococcoidia bacterium]
MTSFNISTVGCQMNVSDSEKLSSSLVKMGFESKNSYEESSIIVVNTCVVRQSAEDTTTGFLGKLRKIKTKSPEKIIVVMGCMVGPDSSLLKKRFSHVDLWARPQEFYPILDLLSVRFNKDMEGCLSDLAPISPKISAFVPIVHGCNKFCTFCIIPFRRGKETSRDLSEIYDEIDIMVDRGLKEVTLLGQNVDSYGHDLKQRLDLADLVEKIHEIKGLERIRFLTSHPNDMSRRIINLVADLPKVCENINLPVQAGDNTVLVNMRRGYTVTQYLKKIDFIKNKIPDISLTTDLIVGFPNETNEQFQNSINLLKKVQFDKVHVAAYSNRNGTYASRKLPDNIDRSTKKERLNLVDELQKNIQKSLNSKMLAKNYQILVEGRKRGVMHGRTRTDKIVYLNNNLNKLLDDSIIGKMMDVKITDYSSWSLSADVIKNQLNKFEEIKV